MRRIPPPTAGGAARQRGAVLVVALLFLMIISMLGVSAMQSTSSEERMSGNTRDWNNALQAAEAALRDAWIDIGGFCAPGVAATACAKRNPAISGSTGFGNGGNAGTCSTTGLCMPNGVHPNYPLLNISNWSATGTGAVYPVTYGTYTLGGSDTTFATTAASLGAGMASQAQQVVSQPPQYIIEALCTPDSNTGLSRGPGCSSYYYRVTARGYGGNSNTQVTLQMVMRL